MCVERRAIARARRRLGVKERPDLLAGNPGQKKKLIRRRSISIIEGVIPGNFVASACCS
jgi:hypothetical protein